MSMTIFGQREHFSKERFSKNSKYLQYRFAMPEGYIEDDTTKYPLLLFLHGAGERGGDNEMQLTYIDKIFGSDEFRQNHKCFIIVPQCPEEKKWVDVDWDLPAHDQPELMSETMTLTMFLLFTTMREYNIDTQRIYVVGLSMGGYGTWDLITRFPFLFAGAIPICGGGDEKVATEAVDVPVWAFHGAKDNLVPVERSRNMVNAIKGNGGSPKYTEFPSTGHLAWVPAFETKGIWEWLFEQKKTK